jgi:LuxR family maltose regulon positive regulatory protein
VAAGEVAWAARLVERHAEAVLWRGEGATLDRWLAALPAELVHARPRLCVVLAWRAGMAGRLQEVEELLAAAERAFASSGDEPHEPSVGQASSVLTQRRRDDRAAACHPSPLSRRRGPRGRVRAAGPEPVARG